MVVTLCREAEIHQMNSICSEVSVEACKGGGHEVAGIEVKTEKNLNTT